MGNSMTFEMGFADNLYRKGYKPPRWGDEQDQSDYNRGYTQASTL